MARGRRRKAPVQSGAVEPSNANISQTRSLRSRGRAATSSTAIGTSGEAAITSSTRPCRPLKNQNSVNQHTTNTIDHEPFRGTDTATSHSINPPPTAGKKRARSPEPPLPDGRQVEASNDEQIARLLQADEYGSVTIKKPRLKTDHDTTDDGNANHDDVNANDGDQPDQDDEHDGKGSDEDEKDESRKSFEPLAKDDRALPDTSTMAVESAPAEASDATDSHASSDTEVSQDSSDDVSVLPSQKGMRTKRHLLKQAHPSLRRLWSNIDKIPIIKPSTIHQPTGIIPQLKSFQLQGVDWMMKMEKSEYKGGLLADEMGMGKTIQTVSLMMSSPPEEKTPSLVVVPFVAMGQWYGEIKAYTDGKLKVLKYHSSANPESQKLKPKDLKKYDVIITTYHTLEHALRRTTGSSRLHSITYHRLILDEAHEIKARKTKTAKACFAVEATHRWALSGTPIQNRIQELYSLLRLLRVDPFAYFFCNKCECRVLDYCQDGCDCGHAGSEHMSIFNHEISMLIAKGETQQAGLARLNKLTNRMMIRRRKADYTSSMELPPKEVRIIRQFFNKAEREYASQLMNQSSNQVDRFASRGTVQQNYANIFSLLTVLRQVADHRDLIRKKDEERLPNILYCNLCLEPAQQAIKSRCRHIYCRPCAQALVESFEEENVEATCQVCHVALSFDWDQPDIDQQVADLLKTTLLSRIDWDSWVSSTKIERLVYELYRLRRSKQSVKSIIFSQFTTMLYLVERRLQKAGFKTVMLEGTMNAKQRQKSIEYFKKNPDVDVFLVSLKAGGVALNLTEASHVFIIDPWWNPAAESQSADRCHRMGQRRPCTVTRIIIEDSVEFRVVLLQEKKGALTSGALGDDKTAIDKLTPEDLVYLFRRN